MPTDADPVANCGLPPLPAEIWTNWNLDPVLHYRGGAGGLWRSLLAAGDSRQVVAIASGFTTSIHMGLLGAVLTFAPRPLFAPHAATTWPWGLSPLADQQLGG